MYKSRSEMTAEELAAAREQSASYRATKRAEDPVRYREQKRQSRLRYMNKGTPQEIEAKRQANIDSAKTSKAKRKAQDPDAFRKYDKQCTKRAREQKMAVAPESVLASERQRYRLRHPLSNKVARQVMAELRTALPVALTRDQRNEVTGSILLAVADGAVRVKQVSATVKRHIADYFREYETHKNLSLDAANPVTGLSWIENLDSEADHF